MRWFATAAVAGSAALSLATASKLTPPVLPLTVRNPYLSTWLGDARINPWNKWPMFWTGEEVGRPGIQKTGHARRQKPETSSVDMG